MPAVGRPTVAAPDLRAIEGEFRVSQGFTAMAHTTSDLLRQPIGHIDIKAFDDQDLFESLGFKHDVGTPDAGVQS